MAEPGRRERAVGAPGDETRFAGGTAYRAEGSGEPIMLVHGVGMNKAFWTHQVAAFATSHRVIAYDLLGHGETASPDGPPTLASFVRQLGDLMDALGLAAANVVGHSMGALIALGFALEQPTRVLRVAALNAVHERSDEQRRAVLERAGHLARSGAGPLVEQTLARWFGEHPGPQHAESVARARAWLAAAPPRGYAEAYRVFAESDRAHAGRLQALRMPALFLTGELDPNSTPEMSARMAAAAPQGTSVALPGERHMMVLASASAVNRELRAFLDTVPQRSQAAAPA
ncbi:MAG: alpha/beta fold hydrolase [Dongiaceae bacterium]